MANFSFDATEFLIRIMKYFFEGFVVALAAYFIPNTKLSPEQIVLISLTAACTFSILDFFAPSISSSARTGAGFGIGANLVGFPGNTMKM